MNEKTIQTEALVAVTSVDWSDKNIGKIKNTFHQFQIESLL